MAKYLTPDGRDINQAGIEPDIILELSEADRERIADDRTIIGTLEDPQYATALELLTEVVQASQQTALTGAE